MRHKFVPPRTRKAREQLLTEQRALKMARSAHAYVRGNTRQFYEWLDTASAGRIPDGPDIWICGDCHIGNLGPVSDATGKLDVQIRDLDQTVIGNPAHDIIRLGLSLAMVARGSDLPGVTTARMLEAVMLGYRRAMTSRPSNRFHPEVIAKTFKNALRRKWRHLARERLEGLKPTIPQGRRFWPMLQAERGEMERLFQGEELRALLTQLKHRDTDGQIELLDAAYWVKGCSSLGTLRFAALVSVSGAGKTSELCLVDIKQAVPAAAPRAANATMPRDHAERVVTGARNLSPHLGDRMLATAFADTPVVVRELLPQDLKLDISRLTRDEAISVAQYLAQVVGHAHWRQMDAAQKRSWVADLDRNYSKTIDTPSWLWSSVVELSAKHEAGYLEHCRRYALAQSR